MSDLISNLFLEKEMNFKLTDKKEEKFKFSNWKYLQEH
jgi:hypothetical protein